MKQTKGQLQNLRWRDSHCSDGQGLPSAGLNSLSLLLSTDNHDTVKLSSNAAINEEDDNQNRRPHSLLACKAQKWPKQPPKVVSSSKSDKMDYEKPSSRQDAHLDRQEEKTNQHGLKRLKRQAKEQQQRFLMRQQQEGENMHDCAINTQMNWSRNGDSKRALELATTAMTPRPKSEGHFYDEMMSGTSASAMG
ncbi:unnamed protein product [Protopolystoma xenopodis]|uniref:Uncharacterized protein n=1 Tax=Protopolystoma xenopodis TaxID=117903 RepID=A0A3S5A5G2_9PLAT|nr:unnamed protein product [Protopolystoma xenopodis]